MARLGIIGYLGWIVLVASFLVPLPAQQPQWVALGPRAAEAPLRPLMEHRAAQGLAVRFVALEDLPGEGPAEVRVDAAVAALEPRPRYLLLIGDGAGGEGAWVLPPVAIPRTRLVVTLGRIARTVLSDAPYADLDEDGLPDIAVGRFPVRNAAELAAVVSKTLDYERSLPGGLWQRQAAYITGEGHYGQVVDALLEGIFKKVVDGTHPADVEVDVTYANPNSGYFWPPTEFADKVRQRMEEGSLFFTYVGHGAPEAVDRIWTEGGVHAVMDVETVSKLARRSGRPIMTILACWTAAFTDPKDCILEVLFRNPEGPVATLGATIPSAPFGNAVFGYELARAYHDPANERLGPAVDAARRALIAEEKTPLRASLDQVGELMEQEGSLQDELREHIAMYVLFGDPALVLRRPSRELEIAAPDTARAGSTLEVEIRAPKDCSSVLVTLEVRRLKLKGKLPEAPSPEDPDRDDRIRERHRRSNDKVLVSVEAPLMEGIARVALEIPSDLRRGRYVLKAAALGADDLASQSREIRVQRRSRR